MSFQGCRQAQAAQQRAYEAFRREEAGYDVAQPGKGPGLAAPVPQVEQDENDPWWKELVDGAVQAVSDLGESIVDLFGSVSQSVSATSTPSPIAQLLSTPTFVPTLLRPTLTPTFLPTMTPTPTVDNVPLSDMSWGNHHYNGTQMKELCSYLNGIAGPWNGYDLTKPTGAKECLVYYNFRELRGVLTIVSNNYLMEAAYKNETMRSFVLNQSPAGPR
jgi:hypothetical protein